MYHVFDGETENRAYYGRFASPWHPDNYMVAYGWKNQGDSSCSFSYQDSKEDKHTWHIPETATVIVGHNLRFDLMWIWNDPSFIAFIKRGGKVWCTQYAEYLLEGHDEEYHMVKLETLSKKYGGTCKVDAVKAMWADGKLTSQIPKDLLLDYLIGTEEEGNNAGDIGNTENIYLKQIQRAKELGMTNIIEARMDGYLATTEMEMNGVNIDLGVAFTDMMNLQRSVSELHQKLNTLIPDVGMPDTVEFNWGSPQQVSAILFGGYVNYTWSDTYIDEETGELARTQEDVPHFYLVDGSGLISQQDFINSGMPSSVLLEIKSGKKKGSLKTKNVKLKVGKIKTKRFEKMIKFPRQIEPLDDWKGAMTDALDRPCYSVGKEVIEDIAGENNEIARTFAVWKQLVKVVDTYYMKTAVRRLKDGREVVKHGGMLTFVKPNGILNHYLNHTSTVTGRMSSKDPNLQNVPRGDDVENDYVKLAKLVKRMFSTRFKNGVCVEADYSQLEVVVNGYLTKDPNLLRDLEAGVDFHCKHVALKNHIPYEEAFDLCKVKKLPEWGVERTKCKGYTFKSEYGAGIKSIAKSTGMTLDEVKGIKDAVAAEYPVKTAFPISVVQASVERSAIPYNIVLPHGGYITIQKGYWASPTGTRFCFRSERAPSWLRERGVEQSFKSTKIMNYPTQGTGGEIMQVQLGVLFRECVKRGWWSGNPERQAVLVNTVHDCVWGDSEEQVANEFGKLINDSLSGVPETYMKLFGVDVGVKFPVEVEYGRNMLTMFHTIEDLKTSENS